MTAVPVPSAPDRRAHEQQQLAVAVQQRAGSLGVVIRDAEARAIAAALLAPDGAVTALIEARVAEAIRPFEELAAAQGASCGSEPSRRRRRQHESRRMAGD